MTGSFTFTDWVFGGILVVFPIVFFGWDVWQRVQDRRTADRAHRQGIEALEEFSKSEANQ